MKRFITIIAISLTVITSVFAQCTPNLSITTRGLYPPDTLFPCIEQGISFDEVIQIKNFDQVLFQGQLITINWIEITNISNIPTSLSYSMYNTSGFTATNHLDGGENGCLIVSGTTNAQTGIYNLGFEADVNITIPLVGPTTVPMDSATLAGQGLGYSLKVIAAGAYCSNTNTGGGGNLAVSITGGTLCSGSQLDLIATGTGGTSPYTYSWSGGTAVDSITTITTSGTYTVTVTDNASNSATNFITITSEDPPTAGFTSSVNGAAVAFTNTSANATSYSWNFGDGSGASSATNPSYTYNSSGTYSVTLTAISANCGQISTSNPVTVSVSTTCTPLPAIGVPSLVPPADNLPCAEQGVAYDETLYFENFDEVTVSGFTATVNFVRFDSITNLPCGIDYTINPVNGTVNGGETACISLSGTTDDVAGQYRMLMYLCINVTVGPLGTQEFCGEVQDLIAQLQQIGATLPIDLEYWLRVKEAGGLNCPAIDRGTNAVNLSSPNALFDFTENIATKEVVFSSNVSASSTVSWDFGDGTPTNATEDPTYTYAAAGVYSVVFTVTNDCGTKSTTQTVDLTSSIFETANRFEVSVLPNPNTGLFSVAFDGTSLKQTTATLYTLSGKEALSEVWNVGAGQVVRQIDASNLAKGVYMLQLRSENQLAIEKIIIK